MKLLAKPISSPSRTDNFPPPLLRFLRSNGGSKSRGRSRSSPLFIRKKSETLITQEPTSPEVTCMGQVRGSVSKNKRKKKKIKKKKNRCEWIQNALFCRHLDRTNSNSISNSKESSKPVWRRWGIQKKLEIKEDSSFTATKPDEFEDLTEEEIGEDEDEVEAFVTKTPPKNALLLMRCRSEPYRSSSLANRFWGSPENEEQEGTEKTLEEEEISTLKTESSCRDSSQESRLDTETEMKLGFCQGFESSSSASKTTETNSTTTKMEAEISSGASRPVLLTRCKSEPARRSEKFEPDMCFWKKRLEFVDISTTSF